MAQYTVKHTCDHSHTYSLFGPHKDRERKIEWLSEQECPRCRNESSGPVAYITRHSHDGADQATIDVVNSYAVKDLLKSRGYRFGAERVVTYTGNDLLKAAASKLIAAWYIHLEKLQVDDEIGWLREQGWTIIDRGSALSLLMSPIEGRPEVVIPAP